jgi:hypothetical protein
MSDTAFEAHSVNISALLGEDETARVIVPRFQRPYSWDSRHVKALWTDISEFVKQAQTQGGPQKYFLGPIVILRKVDGSDLLDGQQRIATITILFSVLRDFARQLKLQAGDDFAAQLQAKFIAKLNRDGEDIGQFALQLGELDAQYFADTVQRDPVVAHKDSLHSHRNIKNARKFLMDALLAEIGTQDPPSKLAFLKRLKLIVQRDLVMTSIPVDSERDAFQIFETLNDRGLRLSVPDLLLNYLMREAQDSDRTAIRDYWNQMLERMGTKIDTNKFIRHMWVSKYGDLKKTDLFTALKELIKKNKIVSLDLARTCQEECDNYATILNANESELGTDVSRHVTSLVRSLDVQPALPLLLSAYKTFDLPEFDKVVTWIIVYVMRYSVLGNQDPSGMETVLFGLARDVRAKMDVPEKEKSAATKTCLAHIKDTLSKNAPSDSDTQKAAANANFESDSAVATYVLRRIANYIQSPTKDVTVDEVNLEHIFPRNPKSNEWGGPKEHEILKPLTWHIGNLTIYGKKANSRSGNEEYSVKRNDYATKSTVVMTNNIAKYYQTWDETTIVKRAAKLAKQVVLIWDFANTSRV